MHCVTKTIQTYKNININILGQNSTMLDSSLCLIVYLFIMHTREEKKHFLKKVKKKKRAYSNDDLMKHIRWEHCGELQSQW